MKLFICLSIFIKKKIQSFDQKYLAFHYTPVHYVTRWCRVDTVNNAPILV